MDYQREEKRVHLILYHLVWTTKRGKPVLKDDIAADCRRLIEQKCAERGWEIVELAIHPNHIRLSVRVWPSVSPDDVVRKIKRPTSHEMRKSSAFLRKLPSLWTRAYFAATVGNVSNETVRAYIESQKGM